MRTSWMRLLSLAALAIAPSTAHAFSHVNNYETNIGNYRTCTAPLLLDSCPYENILSPSLYYFAHTTKSSLIAKSDGTVQVRIDSGSLLHDSNVSYDCLPQKFACVAGQCTGPDAPEACTANRCLGGSNDGGTCNNNSACPSGACTIGSVCDAQVCQGGPRDDKRCGGSEPSCSSVADSTGWNVVFRGNQAWYDSGSGAPTIIGDDDSGCMRVCGFNLNSSGAINGNTSSCSTSGPCTSLDTFHHVEIRDPQGEVVGIPTVGNAYTWMDYFLTPGDPVRVGDCNRPANAAYCP